MLTASSASDTGAVTVVDTASRSTSFAQLERRVPRPTVGHRLMRWSAVVIAFLVIGSITPASATPFGPAAGPVPAQSSGPGSAGVGSSADVGTGAELLVADYNGVDSVRWFGLDGAAAGILDEADGLVGAARAIEVGPDGLVYVAGADTGRVVRYNPADGSLVDVVVDTDAELDNPRALTFDDDGRLLVASAGTDEIVSFDPETGERLGVIAAGGLDNPGGMLVDDDGRIWVTSQHTDSIIGYNAEGEIKTEIETGPGSGPVDLTIGPGGVFFVAMADGGRVDVVTLPVERSGLPDTDAVVEPFVSDGMVTPTAVSIGPDGALWVADHWSGTIRRFDATTGADLGFEPGSTDGVVDPVGDADRAIDASFGPADIAFLLVNTEAGELDPTTSGSPADSASTFVPTGPADRAFAVSNRVYDAVVRADGVTLVTNDGVEVVVRVAGAAAGKRGRLVAASRRGDPAEPGVSDVWFDDVLGGVDLVWTSDGSELEYSFVLPPGARPDNISLDFGTPVGVWVDGDGNAVLGDTGLLSTAPVTYQDTADGRIEVVSRYLLRSDGTVGFEVESYDPALPLVIDPTFRSSSIAGGTYGSGASINVPVPAGTTAGDLLVAQVVLNGPDPSSITPGAGWTTIAVLDHPTDDLVQGLYWRVATASEPATYAFTLTIGGTGKAAGAIGAYSDVDTTNPIDAFAGQANTGTNITAPSITTTVPGATLIGFFAARNPGPVASPAGMTKRWEASSGGGGTPASKAVAMGAGQQLGAAGSTGTRTATFGAGVGNIGHLVALRPAEVTVNSTGDASDNNVGNGICSTGALNSQGAQQCTLRAAIQEANASGGINEISFNIPTTESGYQASPVAFRIQPTTVLPDITSPVVIDAATQPQHAVEGRPVIVLDGTSVPLSGDPNGLSLNAGSSTIRGFVIQNFGEDGIQIDVNGNNTIVGNYIGTDVTGTLARPNGVMDLFPVAGISVKTNGNVIGGTTAADRNVISGSTQFGIAMRTGATNNTIIGNHIGTNATGTAAVPNQDPGIYLDGTAGSNIIGGTAPGAGNLISGNNTTNTATSAGVYMLSSGNTVQGNLIGTDAGGTAALFNDGAGITLAGGAANNLIGGVGGGNTIAHNKGDGVRLMSTAGTGNSILGNSIHSNDDPGLGIDLANNTVTANDAGDGDTGSNDLLNFPVVSSAEESGGTVTVTFDLDVPANTDGYRVEFFANPSGADGSGNGEGEQFVSAVTVSPGTGLTHDFAGSAGDVITATATAIDSGAVSGYGSTSEFSAAVTVGAATSTTVTFQQDNNGYTGTVDTWISSNVPNQDNSADVLLQIDDSPLQHGLIRFDGIIGPGVDQIPVGATIISADLTFEAAGSSGADASLSLYRVLRSWVETDTWDSLVSGISTDNVEANIVPDAVHTGGLDLINTPITVTGLEAAVQAWVDGDANQGWLLTLDNTNGWDAQSSENADLAGRPRLEVTYVGPVTHIVNSTGDGTDATPGDSVCDTGATNSAGDPECTLRAAIAEANASATIDIIEFAMPATEPGHSAGVWTISPGSALPTISGQTTIDGSSQPGWVDDPVVRVDGASAGGASGVTFGSTSDGSTVDALMVTRFTIDGVYVSSGADGVTVSRSWIGSNGSGLSTMGNGDDGIDVNGINAVISDSVVNHSGDEGIDVRAAGATITGTMVGLEADGLGGAGNTDVGIAVFAGSTTIGGAGAGDGNVISLNWEGIEINSSNNVIQGNKIGTGSDGITDRGNDIGDGIEIQSGTGTRVGGTAAGAGNVIAFNQLKGVDVTGGNDNPILGNTIHSNGGLGIDLGATGVTANDSGDGDSGANNLLNHPVITSAVETAGTVTVTYNLDVPAGNHRVEFFRNTVADSSGYGEGETFVSAVTATAGTGLTHAFAGSVGDIITATATRDLGGGSYGSTSEFSAVYTATSGPEPVVLDNIQKGTATLSGGLSTVSATIAAVDPAKSFLTFSIRGNDANPDNLAVTGELTNATTVTFQRPGTVGTVTIEWSVVEFVSGVSVQRGTTNVAATTTNVAISSVDLTRSFALIGDRAPGTTFGDNDFVRAELTSPTNLRLSMTNTNTNVVKWQVVTYDDASVQSGTVSFGIGDASRTATITAVDPAKTWLMYSISSANGTVSNIGQKLIRGRVTNGTTLTFDRSNTGQTMDVSWFAVAFTDATEIQHASVAFAATDTTKDVAIASVDPSRSIAVGGYKQYGGRSAYSADDNPGVGWFTTRLTTSTSLRVQRDANLATADLAWTIIHWPSTGCTLDSDGDGLWDCEEDANTDADDDPSTNPGPDTDGDTTPNHLDADDDGDGTPTASENADPNSDGDPRDARDTDRDGQPDYLDAPTIPAAGTVATEQKISETAGGLVATLDTSDRFGRSVASIGDVDGDGVIDIAVGAPFDDDGSSDRGAVYVLFLNPNGTVKAEQKISDTAGGLAAVLDNSDEFGIGVAGLGDLDGDGIPDLAVGAHQDDDGGGNLGAVHVLFLNANGTVKAEQKISHTQGGLTTLLDANDRFGSSVASIGDLDGDGLNDIVVGAKDDDDTNVDSGAVHVLFLNANGTVKAEQKIGNLDGGLSATLSTSTGFGIGVAGPGDVDGDGIEDIAVGAWYDDDGGTNRGAAYVLFLNANGTVKGEQKISDTAGGLSAVLDNNDAFGTSVGAAGDVDGDGVADLLVGAPGDGDGASLSGAAYVLLLNANGTVKAEQKISNLEGDLATTLDGSDQFGYAVAGTGDLDGDGTIGVTVGVYGDDDGGPADRGAVYNLDLATALTLTVNSTGDGTDATPGDDVCDTGGTNSGGDPECTLRAAIEESNSSGGATVQFAIPTSDPGYTVSPLAYTLAPASPYPMITAPTVLDATTQAGYSGDPIIEIDGTGAVGASGGLILWSDYSTIRGFAVHSFVDEGLEIAGSTGFGDNNTLQNNWVGLDAAGTVLGNGDHGILVTVDALDNLIGGTGANDGNVVAGSTSIGVLIRTNSTGNAVLGNSVYSNTGLGIDLDEDGVTPNDAGDGDTGSNDLLNFPVISSAEESGGTVTVTFDLDVPANTDGYRVEFYANPSGADPSGNGEGEQFVSAVTVSPGTGLTHDFAGSTGDVITATATAIDSGATSGYGPTSEYSAAVTTTAVTAVPPTTVTFQQDNNGYTGTIDTWISNNVANQDNSADVLLQIDNSPVQHGLLRFDGIIGPGVDQIPVGATIISADLTFEAADPSGADASLSLYRVLRSWVETDTWNSLVSGISTDNVEANMVPDAVHTGGLDLTNTPITITGLKAAVQAWVDGDANQGWLLTLDNTNGWDAQSSENADLAGRPRLEVNYAVGPVTHIVNSTGDGTDATPGDAVCDTGGTNSAGDPECTLRAAIAEANAFPTVDIIHFAMPATEPGHSAGVWTISPGSALPNLSDQVTIDGSTQPGWTTTPVIELDGTSAGVSTDGFRITADNVTIRGLAINRFGADGIELVSGATNALIAGNHIGVDASGTLDRGNGGRGIDLGSGSGPTTVGGSVVADRNVISGNGGNGVIVFNSNNNIIIGNHIGTDVTGNAPLANVNDGVHLGNGSAGNTIGQPGAGNVLSGNADDGFEITSTGANNVVQANKIGLGADGDTVVANGRYGVVIYNGANNTTIGGGGAGEGNVISGNVQSGVIIDGAGNPATTGNVIAGNLIGTDATGLLDRGNGTHGVHLFAGAIANTIGGALAGEGNVIAFNAVGIQLDSGGDNSILRNSLFSNTGLGIDLGGDGLTPNDAGDGDPGSNDLLNFPVILPPPDGGSQAAVELDIPAGDYRIEIFANPTDGADPSGHGEGETYLGAATVTHTGSGIERFTVPLGSAVAENDVLAATTTEDLGGGSYGSTSEFSAAVTVGPAALTVNSTGDSSDSDPGDGYCYTGALSSEGDPECTLRAAIAEVNALGVFNVDTNFAIPISDVGYAIIPRPHWTIAPTSPLPAITAYHDIDATTQAGWAALTPVVYVDGAASGATNLIHYSAASPNSLLDGMGIVNAPTTAVRADVDYIYLNNLVVGVDVDGTTGAGSGGDAVVFNGQHGDVRDSVISAATGAGVRVTTAGSNFSITESHIGTGTDGTGSLGNTGGGIIIDGGDNHLIGLGVRDANVIAHNSVNVQINGTADNIGIENNLIGVDLAGVGGVGSVPVEINTVGSVRVGGELSTEANTIRYGAGAGVTVNGAATASVLGNTIWSNGGLGIDLGGDGVTANDPGDGDIGPNNLLNHPVLAIPGDGDSLLTATLDVPVGNYRIEVFTNPTEGADPSGYGEGETLVAATTVTHTGSGAENFAIVVPAVSLGQVYTATATLDLGVGPTGYGPTSEFSAAVAVAPTKPVVLDSSVRRSDLEAHGGLDPAAAETTGITGRAIPFDGFGDRLVGPALNIGDAALTMTARIRPDSLGGTSTLVSKQKTAGAPIYELTVNGAGQVSATLDIGGGPVSVSGGSVSAGAWHDVVATWDGIDAVLFVDGVEVDRAPASGSLSADIDTTVAIGNRADGSAGFDGLVDHVEITHDPVNAAEVALRHANTVAGTLTATVGQQQSGAPGPWTVDTAQSRSGTYALAAPATADSGSAAWVVATGIDEPGLVFESWWWIDSTTGVDLASGTRAGAAATDQLDAAFISGSDWALRRRFGPSNATDGTGMLAPSTAAWVKVEQWTDQNGNSRLIVDGTEVVTWTGQTSPPATGSVGFRVGQLPGPQVWFIDDARARKLISPEPVATLGPLDRD